MLTGAHARGRRHSLQGQGNFILENVQAHHITSERRGGRKVLLKMAREPQKELQLSPGPAAFRRCQPRDRARRGAGAAAGAELQLRAGAAEERGLLARTALPAHPGNTGHNAGLQPPAHDVGFESPVLRGGRHKFGCRCLSEAVFGEEGAARARWGAGGRGLSRERSPVTAGKDPESYGPGVVNVRLRMPSPLKLRAKPAKAGESMKSKRKRLTGRDKGNLSNAQTRSDKQRMGKVLLAPLFLPAGHPHLVFISLILR